MTSPACPHHEKLIQFVRCELTEDLAVSVLDHLDSCSHCEETVAKLETTVQSVLPGVTTANIDMPFAEEFGCQRAIQSLVKDFAGTAADCNGSATSEPTPVLKILRDFRIIEKIGQGGMGTVYKAVHQRMQRTVALKVLPAAMLGDPGVVARFNREMSILGQLNHPNIVQAFDAGDYEGQHYLAMELVDGKDLSAVLNEHKRLKIADACVVVSQAAAALQYAHEKGFVHRDIKPSNLMLATVNSTNGAQHAIVKLLDLGLARVFGQQVTTGTDSAELTSAGQIMGTLNYMAPEQGSDSHQVDIRTDIYSLGATLYKLLTGDAPFAEHASKAPMQRLMAIATLEPPSIRGKRSDIPAPLAAIIHRMLAKSPEHRYSTPEEVVRALDPFCKGSNLVGLLQSTAASAIPNKVAPQPLAAGGANLRWPRKRLMTAMMGAAFLAILGVILSITTREGVVTISTHEELPADVKIVVSDGGREVAILQKDNNWTVKVVNGKYQIDMQGGEDQFAVRESALNVTRLGTSIVTIETRTIDEKLVAAASKNISHPPVESVPRTTGPGASTNANMASPEVPMTEGKPFRLIRDGAVVRDYSLLAALIDELKPADIVEVLSNERLTVRLIDPVTRPLHIRAGQGFRPVLDFRPHHTIAIENDFSIEGCDVDWRDSPLRHLRTGVAWSFRNCRIWGYIHVHSESVAFADSIVVIPEAVAFLSSCKAASFENCLIRYRQSFLSTDSPQLHLKLNDCTFHAIGHGTAGLLHDFGGTLGPESKLTIEATGNIFDCNLTYSQLIPVALQPQVIWIGNENLFCGRWYEIYMPDGDGWKLDRSGLDAWNEWLETPEKNSRELPSLALEWGRVQRLTGTEIVRGVQERTEQIKQSEKLPNVGADWDLIGPGEAYVRALAAEGRPVATTDLRPERLEAGAIILLHADAKPQGFAKLDEALDVAVDQDIIELRTDGIVAGTSWTGENRLLTFRAAPGYSPTIKGGLTNLGSDRLIVEGLTFVDGHLCASGSYPMFSVWDGANSLFPGTGSFVRVANCQVDETSSISGRAATGTDEVPEILNCLARDIQIGLPAEATMKVGNSVINLLSANMETYAVAGGRVVCDHCAFWWPETTQYSDRGACTVSQTPVTFEVDHCVFVARTLSSFHAAVPDAPPIWSGNHNVYVCGDSEYANRLLQSLQEHFHSDSDSRELLPFEFNPSEWRIHRDQTNGYVPKPDGADYGARIDELIHAMK